MMAEQQDKPARQGKVAARRGGRRLFRLAAPMALLLVSAGQCTPPTFPSIFVLLGTPAVYGSDGLPAAGPLAARKSTDGTQWAAMHSPVDACPSGANNPASQCARSDIAPAIASSNALYVAAWWGPKNDPNLANQTCAGGSRLFVATFDPSAAAWSPAAIMGCLPGDHLGPDARPALAWASEGNRWLLGFTDKTNGCVTMQSFAAGPSGPSNASPVTVPCAVSGAIALGATTVGVPNSNPARYTDLVYLAWNDGSIHVMQSMSLGGFGPPRLAIEAGDVEAGVPIRGGSAGHFILPPYIASTPAGPLLAVSRAAYSGPGDEIALFTTDGTTTPSEDVIWTRDARGVTGVGGAASIPAVTGTPSVPVIAYPTGPTAELLNGEPTMVITAGGGHSFPDIPEAVGVGLTQGPGF